MPVILYDLIKKDPCKCWSLNSWKTRMALHFKGIDYETEWLEYPDINPTFEPLPLEPKTEGVPYSIPTVCLDGKYIVDSWKIAQALEDRNPTPSLRLDDPMYQRVWDAGMKALGSLRQVFVPNTLQILNEPSRQYYADSREKVLGMPLEEWGAKVDLDEQWRQSELGFEQLAALLKENPGAYFLGEEPSYTDFFVVSFLHYLTFVHKELFDRIMSVDDSFKVLYTACEKYLARDDH